MSIIGKPPDSPQTKFCFVYCGPERCDCGATMLEWKHPPHDYTIHRGRVEEKQPSLKELKDQIEKDKAFDKAIDVVKTKEEK